MVNRVFFITSCPPDVTYLTFPSELDKYSAVNTPSEAVTLPCDIISANDVTTTGEASTPPVVLTMSDVAATGLFGLLWQPDSLRLFILPRCCRLQGKQAAGYHQWLP